MTSVIVVTLWGIFAHRGLVILCYLEANTYADTRFGVEKLQLVDTADDVLLSVML